MKKFVFIIAVILSLSSVDSANILGVFPTPSISHQVVFHALMKELAARGHHLTVLTTDLIKIDNPNVTQIDLHESYDVLRKAFNFAEFKRSQKDESDFMEMYMTTVVAFLRQQLSHPEVKKIIKNSDGERFDLVIAEYLGYVPILAFAEIYDCPIVGITSLDTMMSLATLSTQ
jgi:glucuronosyltransferase